MWSIRTGEVVIFAPMCALVAAARIVSWLIAKRQDALRPVSRYDICRLASQANGEFDRL